MLENKLFYRHFGLGPVSNCSPDHILTQLEPEVWWGNLVAPAIGLVLFGGGLGRQKVER